MIKSTFEEWKAEVDQRLFQRVGRTSEHLSDMDYRLHHAEGTTPIDMSHKVLLEERVTNLL